MSYHCKCPRCGSKSFETLESYGHCAQCLYFEDYWRGNDRDYVEALQALEDLRETVDEIDEDSVVGEVPELQQLIGILKEGA